MKHETFPKRKEKINRVRSPVFVIALLFENYEKILFLESGPVLNQILIKSSSNLIRVRCKLRQYLCLSFIFHFFRLWLCWLSRNDIKYVLSRQALLKVFVSAKSINIVSVDWKGCINTCFSGRGGIAMTPPNFLTSCRCSQSKCLYLVV